MGNIATNKWEKIARKEKIIFFFEDLYPRYPINGIQKTREVGKVKYNIEVIRKKTNIKIHSIGICDQ